MTALVILNIKKQLDKNHFISERDARILLAYVNASENRIKELETSLAAANVLRRADGKLIDELDSRKESL